jgi:bifunctional non-homologous end joining protein LigD
MSLSKYKAKRSFQETPEPTGGKASGKKLLFVVQKHDASRLHYDFRLELNGVLKSWAIPKGPSLNPDDKRLAMMVEDHPFDYRNFEGVIPAGNYGAGTVIVWDQGVYEPLEKSSSKAEAEKILEREFKSGSIKIRLFGEKLHGEFALVHIKGNASRGKEENAWLLIKHRDEYASETDITKKDKSVVTDKSLKEVASDKGSRQWISRPKGASKAKGPRTRKDLADEEEQEDAATVPAGGVPFQALLKKGKKSPIPKNIQPMLATMVDKPFDNKDWLYEIKWDGYRAVASIQKGRVELESRHNISFNQKFESIREALEGTGINAVLDGEVVAETEKGLASFQQLQGYLKHGKAAKLVYYVFDILWYEGKDLTHLPLRERKELLQAVLPPDDEVIRYSGHILEQGIQFFKAALEKGLEGVMAKNGGSEYTMGRRSGNWLKIKNNQRMEAIIAGFTKGRENRKYFGAVILGKYEGKELKYIGHSGSGFNEKGLKELYQRFQPLIRDTIPFKVKPKTNMPATWLKPELVCEVKFTEVTDEGILRHPIFMGLREDKKGENEKNIKVVKAPQEHPLRKSKAGPIRPAAPVAKSALQGGAPPKRTEKQGSKGTLLVEKGEKEKEVVIDKHPLALTNLQKLYWKKEKISKGDMLNYYHQVAEYMMPYLVDRPQSLNRHPNGIDGESFYYKNVGENTPSWIKTHAYESDREGKDKRYMVATDEASLLYMANLGCIEINPWHSRIQHPDKPDWCVIDLDPDTTNTFKQVMEAAKLVRQFLDSAKIPCFCKTSGSTGMHLYIPLGAKYTYDQSKLFAEWVVTAVNKELPEWTSLERSPSKRKGKLYLDFLQNRPTQTIAAPYSLRPKPGATVSMPLHWEELKPSLTIQAFTIYNALDRIRQEEDIFKPVLGKGIDLHKILNRIAG